MSTYHIDNRFLSSLINTAFYLLRSSLQVPGVRDIVADKCQEKASEESFSAQSAVSVYVSHGLQVGCRWKNYHLSSDSAINKCGYRLML